MIPKEAFYSIIEKHDALTTRSMFGGTGFFHRDIMYALSDQYCVYLRGTQKFEQQLIALGCQKFLHVKKTTVATVNYYDISTLFSTQRELITGMVEGTMQEVVREDEQRRSLYNQRLRDLPNLQLTTERMLKKVGIDDVATFFSVGAVEAFTKITEVYGHKTDVRLLWKLAAAQDGVYWELLEEARKQNLWHEYELNVYS